MRTFVGRYHGIDGYISGLVFEETKKYHIVSSCPDVRITMVDKADARHVFELPHPTVSSAHKTLRGIARRNGITEGAKALLAGIEHGTAATTMRRTK